jgi:hypothetical protein
MSEPSAQEPIASNVHFDDATSKANIPTLIASVCQRRRRLSPGFPKKGSEHPGRVKSTPPTTLAPSPIASTVAIASQRYGWLERRLATSPSTFARVPKRGLGDHD